MTIALVLEIVSAVVALVALIVMLVNLVQGIQARRQGISRATDVKSHMKVAGTLMVAAVVHGISAMAYDSGAIAATYACGWIAVACIVASSAIMAPAVRKKLGPHAPQAHRALFVVAVLFLLAHIVCGRL